jgi:hypothetical protein
MITPLLAAFIGGWEVILIGTGLAWMAFWIWIYVRTHGEAGD